MTRARPKKGTLDGGRPPATSQVSAGTGSGAADEDLWAYCLDQLGNVPRLTLPTGGSAGGRAPRRQQGTSTVPIGTRGPPMRRKTSGVVSAASSERDMGFVASAVSLPM
jgi:hypothetical protein